MIRSTFLNSNSIAGLLVKACPLILGALAVAVPARAGLVNVGGEGQIVIGAVAAGGVALALDSHLPGGMVILLMMLAGAAAGAVWAGIAGVLRPTLRGNEAISTLLLNYVAIDILLYLIYQPWKDAHRSRQPVPPPLPVPARPPPIGAAPRHPP